MIWPFFFRNSFLFTLSIRCVVVDIHVLPFFCRLYSMLMLNQMVWKNQTTKHQQHQHQYQALLLALSWCLYLSQSVYAFIDLLFLCDV